MNIDVMVDKHYGFGGIMEKIEAGLNLAGKDVNALTVDDLAPIDAFHTRGRESAGIGLRARCGLWPGRHGSLPC